MKKVILVLVINVIISNIMAQNLVYNSEGKRKSFTAEDIDILFSFDENKLLKISSDTNEAAAALIGILPTAVNMIFQLTTNILESREKKFVAVYSKTKSNLYAGNGNIPNLEFIRMVGFNSDVAPNETALSIKLNAHKIDRMSGFVYYADLIKLKYSSARTTSNFNTFDYTIEIKMTFLINNEKKVFDMSPIAVSSVPFNNERHYEFLKHRTDIIPLSQGSYLTEVSIKIIESNPVKVRAEKILVGWNAYKDSTKTIINNFLPKEPPSDGADGNKTVDSRTLGNKPEGK